MNRHLALLTLAQGLFLTNNVTFIAINGLVGLAIAPAGWMSTLPVTGYVVGGALSTALVARSQRAWGRKRSFQLGLVVAILACALCAWAAAHRQFWGLVAGTLVAGYYNANAALYRFAASELVDAKQRERAISWVLAGGLLGAVAGPNLAKHTRALLDVPFAGAYAALVVVAVLGLVVISLIDFPDIRPAANAPRGRPLRELAAQPVFVVAVAGAALGYGVMNLLMSATPIAMQTCALPFDDAALVLEWHVIGMFAPGFFTGTLIARFGALRIMAAGVVLTLACIGIALSGVDLMRFLSALFLLGVGWNFLFTGATALFTKAYRPEERTTAQAAMDFGVFATMAASSFASGALVTTQGWAWLNWGSLLPVMIVTAALLWLARRRSRAQMTENPARIG